jgi:hypothetical protein
MTLAETQALFHAAITEGEVEPGALEECFAGTPGFPPADRVGVYAEMWFWRQVEALRAAFRAVALCVGEERWQALCHDYLRAHPSEHHDIGRLGRHLAAFLRLHPAPDRSDLGDLAGLEWARAEVFFEAPAGPVDREALAALGAEELPRARFRFVPALRLLALDHPVHEVWRDAARGVPASPTLPAPTHLAVWRAGHEVFHAALDGEEVPALRAALAGECLEDICAPFTRAGDPVAAGFAALASWIDEGWVAEVTSGPARGERTSGPVRVSPVQPRPK